MDWIKKFKNTVLRKMFLRKMNNIVGWGKDLINHKIKDLRWITIQRNGANKSMFKDKVLLIS